MPLSVRRALYSLFTVLGFLMMVPLSVNANRVQAALGSVDPLAIDPELSAWISGLGLLFLAGACIAASFLYLALSTGQPKGWCPIENGQPRCARCGAGLDFGQRRCPACEQHLSW
ncbi:MAG TPA: hypothetical protein VLC48_10970 [Gemmatimonadota bacterium]|nr:hypothetical protein [Gemmatimonadota bacterium]